MAVNTLNFGSKVAFVNGLPITLPILASDPGSAVAGDMYYNSTSNMPKVYNGTAWHFLELDAITALTGDGTASGPASAAFTLATVNSNVGAFGSSTSIPSFTVNGKGLITAASGNAVIAPAGTLSGTTLNATVVSSSLTSVGTITTGVWTGTTIAIANGGTGQTSASAAFNALSPITTTGDLIYSASGATNSRLPIGSTNQVLTVVGGVPAWASTGAATLTQNHIFVGNASNVATDVAMSGDATIVASGALTLATVASAGTTGSSTAIPVITINAKGLTTSITTAAVVAPAGTLSGTTLNSTVVSSSLTSLGAQAQALNMNSNLINNVTTPVNPGDAANKSYVDGVANAISWKNAVLVATTANITLSGEQTIDGFLTSASRVLVKNQTTTANNGIYVSAAGAWSRSSDMASWSQVPAAAVFVQEGTVNGDIGFVCTSAPGGTIGTTAITFVQFSSAGAYSADGTTLQLVSGVFSVKTNGIAYSNIQQVTASRLLGNPTGSLANASEITLGATLAFSGSALQTGAGTSDVTWSANSFVTTVAKIAGVSVGTPTGTGNVVFSASPTLTGTITAAAANFSGALGANGGITSTGALTINANAGASAFQIQALNVQRSTNGSNYVIETYTDSTTLTDNSGPTAAFSFAFASVAGEEISYVIENGASPSLTRVGTLRITCSSDGTNPSISDMYSESSDAGVSWTAATNGSNIDIKYTATNQGSNRTMRSDIKSFRR